MEEVSVPMQETNMSYEELNKKYEELGEQYKKLLDDYLDLKNSQRKRNKLIRKLVRENEELNLLLQVKLGRYLNKIKREESAKIKMVFLLIKVLVNDANFLKGFEQKKRPSFPSLWSEILGTNIKQF